MWSKLLRGERWADLPPVEWPSGCGQIAAPASQEAGPQPQSVRDENADAERRLAEMAQQMEHRVGEARRAGFQEGEAAGRKQAAAMVQPVLDRMTRSIEEIASLRPRLMREAEAELVELAVAISRRVLRRELAVDPGALQGLVKAALEKLSSQEICRVRAHPELEAGLRRALERAGHGGVPVLSDATMEPGAVLIETSRGKLDASLETQLAEIGRGLADRLPER